MWCTHTHRGRTKWKGNDVCTVYSSRIATLADDGQSWKLIDPSEDKCGEGNKRLIARVRQREQRRRERIPSHVSEHITSFSHISLHLLDLASFAQTHRDGRHLDELIVFDVLNRVVK